LRGLQGIVHKTISDDLQCNIWKPTHMNKIMPSLLVNLQHDEGFVFMETIVRHSLICHL